MSLLTAMLIIICQHLDIQRLVHIHAEMVYLGKITVETVLYFYQIAAKNGVYITLVRDVRHAFEGSSLVKIDCKGMHASDYKKLGAKLKVRASYVLTNLHPV